MKINPSYLRNRPFMLVKHVFFPGDPTKTHIKNWKERKDWQVKEVIDFVDYVNDKQFLYYDIILDIHRAVLVKNRYEESSSPGEIISYLFEKYKDKILQANQIWQNKRKQKILMQGSLPKDFGPNYQEPPNEETEKDEKIKSENSNT